MKVIKYLTLCLTDEEVRLLKYYLSRSVLFDTSKECVCGNLVAEEACYGNKLGIKAMEIRKKVIYTQFKKSWRIDWEYKILDFIKKIFKKRGKK